jgi:hypothetical protein
MYLNARDPLPINFNPFIMFRDTPLKYYPVSSSHFFIFPRVSLYSKDWVACASSYAVATTQFYTLVRDITDMTGC